MGLTQSFFFNIVALFTVVLISKVCATVGTQNWVYGIAGTEVTSLFKPWYYEDSLYGHQVAGFLTQFTGGVSFATVRFAGHEVPAYQPERALELFGRYLNGSLFYNLTISLNDEVIPIEEEPQPESHAVNIFVVIAIGLAFIVLLGVLYVSFLICLQRCGRPFGYSQTVSTSDMDNTRHSTVALGDAEDAVAEDDKPSDQSTARMP